jgi:hypothetical protein
MNSLEITVHHTVELSGSTAIVLLLAVGLIAFVLLYPMLVPAPTLPPEPAKGKSGFR